MTFGSSGKSDNVYICISSHPRRVILITSEGDTVRRYELGRRSEGGDKRDVPHDIPRRKLNY
jgi:hypothetical protein